MKAPIYEIQSDHIDHRGPDLYDFLNKGKVFSPEAVDDMFRANRRYIQEYIVVKARSDYDIVILDRWTMSGDVYSSFRKLEALPGGIASFKRSRSNSDETAFIPPKYPNYQ